MSGGAVQLKNKGTKFVVKSKGVPWHICLGIPFPGSCKKRTADLSQGNTK